MPGSRIDQHGHRQPADAGRGGRRPPEPVVHVRRATASHAPAIRDIAHAAWRETYAGMLHEDTIEWFLERAYSEDRVALRVERHETWVAELDGVVGAFAETAIEPDRVTLVAIYANPAVRGVGLGSALLNAIVDAHPDLPIAADVLAGNRKGETFYEARGFEPRERVEEQLGNELVAERRWWRPAAATG
jgi:GNAT superfamily N-acetyltransferase